MKHGWTSGSRMPTTVYRSEPTGYCGVPVVCREVPVVYRRVPVVYRRVPLVYRGQSAVYRRETIVCPRYAARLPVVAFRFARAGGTWHSMVAPVSSDGKVCARIYVRGASLAVKPASARVLAAAALVSLAAAGCAGAPPQAVVRAHAANDLACPGTRLDVQGIGGTSFAASGCGLSAVYSCSGGAEGHSLGDDAECTRVTGVTELQAP
jgi:hypothetical protein